MANPYTTNLEMELNARDIVGLTDGDTVATWSDSSAAGNDATQAAYSYRPIYKTNIIGSNPVVRFDASNKALLSTFSSSWSGYTGVTIFILLQYLEPITDLYSGLISMHGGSGNDYNTPDGFTLPNRSTSLAAGQQFYIEIGGSVAATSSIGALVPGFPTIIGISLQQGSNGFKLINPYGAYNTSEAINIPGTPTDVVIAQRYFGSTLQNRCAKGDYGMILIYKEYMSDSNISTVVSWMLDEFGLATGTSGGGLARASGMTGGFYG